MMFDRDIDLVVTSPGSPPGMTSSKTSKSSSFRSFNSDDNSVLADDSHFEDIGLDDDAVHYDTKHVRDLHIKAAPANLYTPSFSADLRAASLKHATSRPHPPVKTRIQRDVTSIPSSRPPYPSLQSHVRSVNVRSTNLQVLSAEPFARPLPFRGFGSRSTTSLPLPRHRSVSPNLSLVPRDPNLRLVKPRRSSWQANRDRKTALELERECDEDDGDDIPDGLVLDNVPISPRPPQERSVSRTSSSTSPSPERGPKERVRSVGNGTPPVALAQGSLRSPSWKSETSLPDTSRKAVSGPSSPFQARSKSWTSALSELSAEAKALTEKLEEHADTLDTVAKRPGQIARPNTWDSSRQSADRIYEQYEPKERIKSALPELPALRRTNIMIDPLPISKEKEAVLSRTRPSWLPPKDPAEERRHLREYQKMIAQSAEADKRREAARRAKSAIRDSAAETLMKAWDDEILPRWNDAIRERRTRDMWWRGVAPRSRGAVWSRAIGNELALGETSYQAALTRAHEVEGRVAAGKGDAEDIRRAAWFATIRQDVEESTWKDLKIFQTGAPLHQPLVDVLSAYAMYRSDIGYVSGCNTIAALLLLNMPSPASAFVGLANMLNRPLPLSFLTSDAGAKASAYNLVLQMLNQKSSSLHDHLVKQLGANDPDEYLYDTFTTLFTSALTIDECSRLWDVCVFEGDAVLVRAAVALLLEREIALLGCKTPAEVRSVLRSEDAAHRPKALIGEMGAEDRWMRAVREAGRC